MLANIEFFIIDDKVHYRNGDGLVVVFSEEATEIRDFLYHRISKFYPGAITGLLDCFKRLEHQPNYRKFRMMQQFCRCNFGNLDTTKQDIDHRSTFNLEKVNCPMRGICQYENVICNPEFNSGLSKAEYRVAELLCQNQTPEQIATELVISVHTVRNHRSAIYDSLDIHSLGELIAYANQYNLFQK